MNCNSSKASKIVVYTLMVLAMIMVGLPLLYALAGSFKSSVEFLTGSTGLLPSVWRWQNYTDAWKLANFGQFTINSALFAIGTVAGTVLTTPLPPKRSSSLLSSSLYFFFFGTGTI